MTSSELSNGGSASVDASPIIVSERFIAKLVIEDAPQMLIDAIREQNALRWSAAVAAAVPCRVPESAVEIAQRTGHSYLERLNR